MVGLVPSWRALSPPHLGSPGFVRSLWAMWNILSSVLAAGEQARYSMAFRLALAAPGLQLRGAHRGPSGTPSWTDEAVVDVQSIGSLRKQVFLDKRSNSRLVSLGPLCWSLDRAGMPQISDMREKFCPRRKDRLANGTFVLECCCQPGFQETPSKS